MRALETAMSSPSRAGSDSSDDEGPYGAGFGLHRVALVGLAAGVLLVGAVLGLAALGSGEDTGTGPVPVKRLGAKTTLDTEVDPFSEEGSDVNAGPGGVPWGSSLTEAASQGGGQQQQQPQQQTSSAPANMSAGHKCSDYEEDHAGLCYTKCSQLVGPDYPHRGSPWTCCRDNPCKWMRWKHSFGFVACSGYAVGGVTGKSCPHRHGACMANEEMFMNECYKTCKELTNGEYPYRKAAASCCKSSSTISCMNPMNDKTSPDFNVGGGKNGDGDPTNNAPHAPHTA